MKKRTPPKNANLSDLSFEILGILKNEFIEQNRSSDDLAKGYTGPLLNKLQEEILADGSISRVDYDLALKGLEEQKLVGTGPMKMYDNPPNSHVVVIAMFSKREFIYLKETGYRVARERTRPSQIPVRSSQNVHITGGNFYQSPIGVGGQVSQQLNFDVTNETDTINYLAELLAQSGKAANEQTKAELTQMVNAANAGNLAAAKPICQRIYGAVSEPIKQLAYGVLTAIITKQMGLS